MFGIKKVVQWFEKQDTFGQLMLLFAGSQIIVAFLLALKEYGIYDVTPVMTTILPYTVILAKALLVIGVLGVIIVLLIISFKKRPEQVNK